MPRVWAGQARRTFRRQVLETYGPLCCLGPDCRLGDPVIDLSIGWTLPPHPGYFTVHHVVPLDVAPHLAYDLDNARPAHFLCNSAQGTKPMRDTRRTRGRW